MDLDEKGGREELRGLGRGKTVIRIHCMRISVFDKRGKRKVES